MEESTQKGQEKSQDIPVQEDREKTALSGTKSSVLQTLQEYKQLVPAQSGAEHVREGR